MVVLHSSFADIELPNISLSNFLIEAHQKYESYEALIDVPTGRSYQSKQLPVFYNHVASHFHRLGYKKGDVIMMVAPNLPEYVIAMIGALHAGLQVSLCNPLFTSREILYQIKDGNVKCVITIALFFDKVKEAADESGLVQDIVTLNPHDNAIPFHDFMKDDGSAFVDPDIDPNDVALLPYSSGTTGLPKGVMLTHRNLVANVKQMEIFVPGCDETGVISLVNQPGENPLLFLPLFHAYGIFLINWYMFTGQKVHTMPKFDFAEFLGSIQKYKVKYLFLVPPIAVMLNKSPEVSNYDLSSVLTIACAAAPLGREMEAGMHRIFPNLKSIGQGYGMTEMSALVIGCLPNVTPSAAVGVPVSDTSIKIVDVNDHTKEMRCGENGEILLRGPQMMKGYINREEATRDTITEDGWLKTGDIGYLDKDMQLYIVDRKKELIKYKGHQVAPAELEALLLSHDSVADVGVVGKPDELAGELPTAYVVKKPNVNLTEDELVQFIADQVSPEKKLRGGVIFIEQIPKSLSGKILRKDLKAQLLEDIRAKEVKAESSQPPRRMVLVAVDHSKHSERAFRWYVQNGRTDRDFVLFCHVLHGSGTVTSHMGFLPTVASTTHEYERLMQDVLKKGEEVQNYYNALAKSYDVDKFSFLFLSGAAAGEALVSTANEHNAGLIVMGSRGLGTMSRTLLGSVSDYVLHHSHRACLIVPPEKR